jgi:short subunit dehydrogenase-like uncharacterized protein
MNILLIGGLGYLGSQILRALRERGFAVTVATRHPFAPAMTRVDLLDPETFAATDSFDVVIDAADALMAPPDELIAYCLEQGQLFIETSSDPETIERLTDRFHATGEEHAGVLVLGAGIFTGLSNLVAAAAFAQVAKADQVSKLELGIRVSPLSRGGQGMVKLIPHLLALETIRYEHGERVAEQGISKGPRLPFYEKPHGTVSVPLAEVPMLAASTNVENIACYMSPAPSILRFAFLLTPAFILSSRPFTLLLLLWFTLLRRLLLRWRSSPVELSAVATQESGQTYVVKLRAEDGMQSAGDAVALLVEDLARATPAGGVYMIDEVTTLEAIASSMTGVKFVTEHI